MPQYRLKGFARIVAASAFLFSGSLPIVAAQTAPDNSKVNAQDRAAGAVTADQQKNAAIDRDLTAKIRKSLMADKSLSTYAHNVKIVTQHGDVTLRGPVRSEKEKETVAVKASAVAGPDHIVNELTIAPARTSNPKS